MKLNIKIALCVIGLPLLLGAIPACKKLIAVDPPRTSITDGNVYMTDKSACAVFSDIYGMMSQANDVIESESVISTSFWTGLTGDELSLFALNEEGFQRYYVNSVSSDRGDFIWTDAYRTLFYINTALTGVSSSPSLSPGVKNQLIGEALFLRAFYHFYLVNIYGDVPIVTSPDYIYNSRVGRSPATRVYEQIVKDLKQAVELLNTNYLNGTVNGISQDRVRPTKAAANALLARTFLYMKEWSQAEATASLLIQSTSTYDTVPLSEVFLKNSMETIWALQPIGLASNLSANTGEGKLFILPESGPDDFDYPVYLTQSLAESFEPGDARKGEWLGIVPTPAKDYYFAKKYKVGRSNVVTAEYPILLRLSEQYLIRAEARAQQNKLTGSGSAQEDLNVIRKRANLEATQAESKSDLLDAIFRERRVELFTEAGHRWFDMQRFGKIDEIMREETKTKGSSWKPFMALYPIPTADLERNPALRGHQNPGYN